MKYLTQRYKHVQVAYLPHLDGGGRGFGQCYVPIVKYAAHCAASGPVSWRNARQDALRYYAAFPSTSRRPEFLADRLLFHAPQKNAMTPLIRATPIGDTPQAEI